MVKKCIFFIIYLRSFFKSIYPPLPPQETRPLTLKDVRRALNFDQGRLAGRAVALRPGDHKASPGDNMIYRLIVVI